MKHTDIDAAHYFYMSGNCTADRASLTDAMGDLFCMSYRNSQRELSNAFYNRKVMRGRYDEAMAKIKVTYNDWPMTSPIEHPDNI